MNEERKNILDMLAEGKITAEEAEQLIAALERAQPPTAASPAARPKGRAKYLRVVMEFLEDGESGRLNVRVPLQLLRAGVQLAALIPPQALDRANAELSKSGVPFDLTQLKPEHLEALVEHLDETIVELEQPDGHLRVFCE
ncbi:SHOCT-like domain-containing protein [Nonomuraea roseola]|uniref:YvlB/LiaX N-terminal domain-containing protein n=1 Tax=Nonomuraea roseola TaxID=46179 RepID=A0ABV5QBT7_9ACTN